MASSQRDIFLSSPDSTPKRLNSSLPEEIIYTYLWCILFDWNEDEEEPFQLFQLAQFSATEMKAKWIKGDLEPESRTKKLSFTPLPGKRFSLFGKVEKCELLFGICIIKLKQKQVR